ncbi:MAG: competence protein ComEC [Cryomorphaceae bacterium]|jgi:competence protein ComEC
MLKKLRTWLLRQPLLLPIAGLVLAILAIDSAAAFAWYALAPIALVAAFTSRKVLALTLIAALAGGSLHHNKLQTQRDSKLLSNQDVEIYAIIDSPPRSSMGRSTEAILKILQGPESIEGKKLLAYIPEMYSVNVGEKIWLKGTIRLPRPPLNPRVFNKLEFLHRKGISIEHRATDVIPTQEIAMTHKLEIFAESSRQWIREKLTYGIEDTDAAKVILAMFLGEKPKRGGEIMTDFKHSGTIHVFAVSGLHVMMIGLIFAILLRILGCPSHVWIPGVIGIMFFYAIVTGMRPPAMRASIMGATVLLAILLLRKPSLPNCLWLSGIIALLWNTHSLFLPGFQLSYAVLIAIAFTGSWWMNRYEWINYIDPFFPHSLLTKKQKAWLHLRRKTSETLAVSTSAWCGSSLLIWLYFGLITPIAIIASVPLMVIVFLLLGTCCLSLLVGSISPTLGKYVNQTNAYTANAAHGISHFFASIPNSRYHDQPWSTGERVVIYQVNKGGGGAYLSLGGGILLDGGSKSQFYREIWPSLSKNGARIDTLIASHPDINHIQGLTAAMKEFPIKQIIVPHGNARSTSYSELIHTAKEKGINVINSEENTFAISDGVNLELVYAPRKDQPLADDRSLVFMLHWHGKRILFLNDSGYHLAHWLRQREHTDGLEKLTPDVLVLGKHSLDDSLHPDIVALLSPKVIIATHSYFPPDQSRSKKWINSIEKQGVRLYLLDQSGAVTITQEEDKFKFGTILDYDP